MKKFIYTLFALALFIQSHAQELQSKTIHSFEPGWFMGVNGGINLYFAEGNAFYQNEKPHIFSFSENGGFTGRAELGYQFSQVVAIRTMLGFAQHNWADMRLPNPDGSFQVVSFGSEHLVADMVLNMSNAMVGYNANRLVDVSIFGGIGLIHRDKVNFSSDYYTATLRGGMQLDFKVTQALSMNIIGDMNILGDKFNDYKTTFPLESYIGLTAGITYRLPSLVNSSYQHEEGTSKLPMKEKHADDKIIVDPYTTSEMAQAAKTYTAPAEVDPNYAATTDAQVAVSEKDKPKVSVLRPEFVVNVFFPNEESDIDPGMVDRVENAAKYYHKNPGTKLIVSGYSDLSTGSLEKNRKLAVERTDRVLKMLVNTYKVSRSHIKSRPSNGSYQPFAMTGLNRVVIIQSEKTITN